MQLSEHFSYEELVQSDYATRKGLDNTPDPDSLENLKTLVTYLEQVRGLLGFPMHVTSGYRSPKVNAAVGGSTHSAHMTGQACDFICPKFGTPQEVARAIVDSDIEFDQVIYEGTWCHFGIGERMRDQALTAHFAGGRVTYTEGIA